MRDVVIMGCGYTGKRVAALLRERGARVVAADRDPSALVTSGCADVVVFDASRPATWSPVVRAATALDADYALLLSIPPLDRMGGATTALLASVPAPGRVVYLSTTAVYGDRSEVDEVTPPQPPPEHAPRLAAERALTEGPWSWMVLRAAAIYGPDRGLHTAEGGPPRRPSHPDRVVSRIHVDDLAALCAAALEADVIGAYPVADLEPASAREVAAFCASMGLVPPMLADPDDGGGPPPPGRRVDGRAVCSALALPLRYPSFRDGIRGALSS